MSDGITSCFRDEDIIEKVKGIRRLESKFEKNPSLETAKEIINNLETLLRWKGYNYQPNTPEIIKDISKYKKYLVKYRKDSPTTK